MIMNFLALLLIALEVNLERMLVLLFMVRDDMESLVKNFLWWHSLMI